MDAYEVKEENEIEILKKDGVLDMIIAFDTTGSMSAYIEDVRLHVKKLIPELLNDNPEIQIGIVAFGDYCDMETNETFGDAYQSIGLTRDGNALIDFVQSSKNTGGGDVDEFYELVLHKIINETNWRPDAKKNILLIADAQPHPVGYTYGNKCISNQIDWRNEMNRAIEMGIEIDTLSLCYYGEDWYKELSEKTNGVYSKFKSSGKTSDFIKTAAYARGGSYTADKLSDVALNFEDSEMSHVAASYFCKNSMANDIYLEKGGVTIVEDTVATSGNDAELALGEGMFCDVEPKSTFINSLSDAEIKW